MKSRLHAAFAVALSSSLCAGIAHAQIKSNPPKPIVVKLDLSPRALDMDSLRKSRIGFRPSAAALVPEKPTYIAKEPSYTGTPLYGAFRIGNGPKSITYFAVDEPKGETGKIFIDVNQNGDLTDDGEGAWAEAKPIDGTNFYQETISIHASWGSAIKEEETGDYSLLIYKRHGDPRMNWIRVTARSGKVNLSGHTQTILLGEESSDGLFTVPKAGDTTRNGVQLFIDLDGDGTYQGTMKTENGKRIMTREVYRLDRPFQIGGQWWDAFPTISGSELTFVPTNAPDSATNAVQAPRVARELLAAGSVAPDFTALTVDGKPIRLRDFKGKVVLLDFWATWCGPCLASMPGLQKIYNQAIHQGVVVFSVNVFDAKDPFDAWIAKNAGKPYTFTFAFDPAGHDEKKSIAASKYGTDAIPTMYVIDREGKIKATIVGSGNERNIVKALALAGVKITGPRE